MGEVKAASVMVCTQLSCLPVRLLQMSVVGDVDGFVVSYNGLPLVAPASVSVPGPAGTTTHLYLNVECGYIAKSGNFTLQFASGCDSSIKHTALVSVGCMQPCPAIQWAPPLDASQPLLINSAYVATSMKNTVGRTHARPRGACS